MKLGVSAFAWTANLNASHLELLPALREIGLQGFEVPMFDPAMIPAADMRRAFEAGGMECTVCAILPADVNPISPDPYVRRCAMQHLHGCVETAAELGATLLGGPLYAPIGYLPPHRPTQDEWSWAVEALQSLGPALDAHRLTLAIEPVNRSETFFLRTAFQARQLCEAVGHPRVGVTIDTFHANIEEKSIPDAIRLLGPHLKHLHASENDRGLLGHGHVDFPGIVAALQEIGYQGYLMIEGFGYDPHDTSGPGFLWADVATTPEQLSREGAQYLCSLLNA